MHRCKRFVHHDYVDDDAEAAAGRINRKFAIVVGMLGLDKQYDVHSELNPVYAMLVHVQHDPVLDQWAFFVMNWGDQGYCGDNQEPLDLVSDTHSRFDDHTRVRPGGQSTCMYLGLVGGHELPVSAPFAGVARTAVRRRRWVGRHALSHCQNFTARGLKRLFFQSAPIFLINEPEISACARGEFEACLEEERI